VACSAGRATAQSRPWGDVGLYGSLGCLENPRTARVMMGCWLSFNRFLRLHALERSRLICGNWLCEGANGWGAVGLSLYWAAIVIVMWIVRISCLCPGGLEWRVTGGFTGATMGSLASWLIGNPAFSCHLDRSNATAGWVWITAARLAA